MEFTKTTYKERTKKQVIYTEEEAKQILITKLEEELKKQIQEEEKIVNTQINSKLEDETVQVELIYEVLENIGTKEKILF